MLKIYYYSYWDGLQVLQHGPYITILNCINGGCKINFT